MRTHHNAHTHTHTGICCRTRLMRRRGAARARRRANWRRICRRLRPSKEEGLGFRDALREQCPRMTWGRRVARDGHQQLGGGGDCTGGRREEEREERGAVRNEVSIFASIATALSVFGTRHACVVFEHAYSRAFVLLSPKLYTLNPKRLRYSTLWRTETYCMQRICNGLGHVLSCVGAGSAFGAESPCEGPLFFVCVSHTHTRPPNYARMPPIQNPSAACVLDVFVPHEIPAETTI